MARGRSADDGSQLSLFGPPASSPGSLPDSPAPGHPGAPGTPLAGDQPPADASTAAPGAQRRASGTVGAAIPTAEVADLGRRLPAGLHLGGSTWSFPGWAGLVYDRLYPQARLARDGLAAYARHPLLRAAGIDRTHYRPLPAADLARYAAVVPEDFLFLVKAHDACTLARFPDHERYGAERGRPNPRFLDAAYAAAEVVAPYAEGLGAKGGALLFQFAPQDLGPAPRFAACLHEFLAALPRGLLYAVELRNRELLTADYAAALAAAGATHCLTVHPRMPDVRVQAQVTGAVAGAGGGATAAPGTAQLTSPVPLVPVVGRWLLGSGVTYEEAGKRFAPFDRILAPDPGARRALADLARATLAAGRRFLLTVNNNAEGSAPLSIAALVGEVLA
jgi:uncharacterized protein YecE (DUF72 family)